MAMARDLDLPVLVEDVAGVHQEQAGQCDPACGPDTCGSDQLVLVQLAAVRPAESQAVDCCEPDCGPACPCP